MKIFNSKSTFLTQYSVQNYTPYELEGLYEKIKVLGGRGEGCVYEVREKRQVRKKL